MTQETLKKMYQLLLTEPHAPTVCAQLERIAREALADHAMQEVQRLGQEIEQEPAISKWSLREVYFDEDGEPISHRSPPQRTWVGLNDDEIDYLIHLAYTGDEEFVQTIEAKLKEKNT